MSRSYSCGGNTASVSCTPIATTMPDDAAGSNTGSPAAAHTDGCGTTDAELTNGIEVERVGESATMLRCPLELPEEAIKSGLTCEFSCCPSNAVPAEYDNGYVSCDAPCPEVQGASVTVRTLDGQVVMQNKIYLGQVDVNLVENKPENSPKDSPSVHSKGSGSEAWKDKLKREYSALKPFAIISSSYLLFTITDGALRMIVLLHAYSLGFTAFETAILFTLYELAGVVTNLAAGAMGARWGIRSTLLTGLFLQVLGIGMLMGWQDRWGANPEERWKGMLYIIISQMWAGIAKDLTKLGGKTVTKLVTPDEKQSKLFKLVSFITGFKNSLKGLGYFLGSALVAINYYMSLGVMMALVVLAMPWAMFGLSKELGQTRKENITLSSIFKQNSKINWLSAARFFLFGSRDLWFEVPLPFFLRDTFFGVGLSRTVVGTYMAVFIIVYGQIQSWSPQLVLSPLKQGPPYTTNKFVGALWSGILFICPLYLSCLMLGSDIFYPPSEFALKMTTMTVGLAAFCVVFAINSSVHSYLVVRYSEGNKVSMNVGFYYMSNAMGRLTGTIVSGALYSFGGGLYEYLLPSGDACAGALYQTAQGDACIIPDFTKGFGLCFVTSCCFIVFSTLLMLPIMDNQGGLSCGMFGCCGAAPNVDEESPAHPELCAADKKEADKPAPEKSIGAD